METKRSKFKLGIKRPKLQNDIINFCELETFQSITKLLEHFYHVDTVKRNNSYRIQGYVFAEDVANLDIIIPNCEVSYIDNKIILFITTGIEITKTI